MRKIVFSALMCALSAHVSFSQNSDHTDGGNFEKRIEYSTNGGSLIHNVSTKPALDKLLFGWTNSMVEYVYSPPFSDVIALRVVKDSLSYRLDVYRLSESDKIKNWLYWDTTPGAIPNMVPEDTLMTFSAFKELVKRRESAIKTEKYFTMLHEKYGPKPKSFEISRRLADKMYDKMVVLIRDFKAVRAGKYKPNTIVMIADGDRATFRGVVGDELWTLKVHIPENRVKQLSNVYNRIITDALRGRKKLNEAKYIRMLDEIDL